MATENPAAAAAPGATEEEVEFPILCESCLGPNPLVRMIKTVNGKACKVRRSSFIFA